MFLLLGVNQLFYLYGHFTSNNFLSDAVIYLKWKPQILVFFSKFNQKVTSRNDGRIHVSKTFLKQNLLIIADFLFKTFHKHFF